MGCPKSCSRRSTVRQFGGVESMGLGKCEGKQVEWNGLTDRTEGRFWQDNPGLCCEFADYQRILPVWRGHTPSPLLERIRKVTEFLPGLMDPWPASREGMARRIIYQVRCQFLGNRGGSAASSREWPCSGFPSSCSSGSGEGYCSPENPCRTCGRYLPQSSSLLYHNSNLREKVHASEKFLQITGLWKGDRSGRIRDLGQTTRNPLIYRSF